MENIKDKIYLKNAYDAVKTPGIIVSPAYAQSIAYANLVAGIDMTANLDRNPNHTSLPSGNYFGIEYTHSDECLAQQFPEVASAIRPLAKSIAAKYYSSNSPIIIDLLIDAVGCVIANSASAYMLANNLKRALDTVQLTDENNLYIGGLLNHIEDKGDIGGKAVGNFYTDTEWVDNPSWRSNFTMSWSTFNKIYNAGIQRLYLSSAVKSFIKLFGGSFIKFRSIDSDTDRFLTLWEDDFVNGSQGDDNVYPKISQFHFMFQQHVDNVDTLMNRFTYLKNILVGYGVYRLTDEDTLMYKKEGDHLNVIYDNSDDFKNLIDHKGVTGAELYDINNTHKIPKGTFDYIFYEETSYFQNLLSVSEGVLIDDSSMAIFFGSDNIRLYEICATVANKRNDGTMFRKFESCFPKNWTPNNSPTQDSSNYALFKQLAVLNTTKIIDSTFVPELKFSAAVKPATGDTMSVNGMIIWPGRNTYVSNPGDLDVARENSVRLILFDDSKITETNKTLNDDAVGGHTAL